jgi:TRAP-type mannitol/chloroaromatic compound transport system substrate-binding protein
MKRRKALLAGATGTAGVVLAALSRPALAQQRMRWTMATSWPAGIPVQAWAEDVGRRITTLSGGRLTVAVQPAGAVVGAFDVLDATSAGTVEMGHSLANFWLGKNRAAPFFGAIPMVFEPQMFLSWMYEGGGIALWNRLYREQLRLNVEAMPGGINITELLAWSNRPLNTLEDFRGLKYRTVGWWAEILRGMGVAVTTLPPGEIYSALERRLLDAAEFASPWIDRGVAFHEVARYFTGPGMHQPASVCELLINKPAWDRLPADLKSVVQTAAEAVTLRSYAQDYKNSMDAIDFFRSRGNQPVHVREDVQREFRTRAWTYLDQQAERDPFFREVWTSVRTFYERSVAFDRFMLPVRA